MQAPCDPAPPGTVWLLALAGSAPLLTCFLSDGQNRFEHASSPWPPPDGTVALPISILDILAGAALENVRLQIEVALDGWPWEAELERARSGLNVSRHLTAAPAAQVAPARDAVAMSSLGSMSRDDPSWIHGPSAQWASLALQSQASARPLLAVSDDVSPGRAQAFQLALKTHWRQGRRLAQAATLAAADCALARQAWRLYGDAHFNPAPGASDEQWRHVTSLSIDLIQSTGLLHSWGAERYAEGHAGFHRLCRRIVEDHGGRLDDPQGDDGLMAYFGLLQAQEDSAAQAVRVSWELVNQVPELGFAVRVGIATGRVAVSEGQPFGLAVHLAARLQRLAPVNGIVLSEGTHALLGPGAVCERLPEPVQLPGFREPQVAYRLVRLPAPEAASWQRRFQSQFVGRQQELFVLSGAWELACSQRRGGYQCLLGEPGIGKTRLLQEFVQTLRQGGRPVTVVMLTGDPGLQTSAFAALATALQGSGLPELAALLHVPEPLDTLAPHERQSERGEMLDDLVAGFLALARRAPVCCVVDDAQWLDPSTIELVERLRLQSQAVPLLLLVSMREDARSLARGLHTLHGMTLPGLDLQQSMDLIGALAASTALPLDLRSVIAGRAGGVPLFLEETVRMVEQLPGGRAALADGIPATLEDLLMSRLETLADAKAMAQLAAVLGTEFPAALWQELMAEPDDWIQRTVQVPDAWRKLLDSGILGPLASDPSRYRFRHALIRDAAYESVWIRDRKRLHGLVARVLERRPANAGADLRAHHLAAAGEIEAAFAAWALAARHAAAAAADREALALAQKALALMPDLPDTPAVRQQALQLHLLQAARYIALEGYGAPSVEAAYLRAAALCDDTDAGTMRIRVELGLEACYAMRGDLERARALAEGAVRSTSWDANLRLALQARWAWTNVVFHQGDLDRALDMADQCLARYHPALHQAGAVQDPAIMFLCYSAWGMFERGCAGEARLRVRRLLELARVLEHPFSHAVAHGFAASVALFRGDYEEGLSHAEEAMRRCTAKAFQAWLAHAQIMRGRLRAALGEPHAGLADMEQGLTLWTATGARITVATYLALQAEVWLDLQEPQAALQKLALASDIARHHGECYHEAELLRLQGLGQWQLRSSRAESEAARAMLQRALQRAREQGKLGFALRSALALAHSWADEGEFTRAAALVREALDAVPDQHGTIDARTAVAAQRLWSVSAEQTS